MSDNKSLEPFFNDDVSEADGVYRNLRVYNPNQPLEGYHISEQESGATSYVGYQNADSKWYIMRSVVTGAVTVYRYKRGDSGYDWSERATDGGLYADFGTTF